MKNHWRSKTLWVSILTILGAGVEAYREDITLKEALIASGMAMIMAALRLLTTDKLTLAKLP